MLFPQVASAAIFAFTLFLIAVGFVVLPVSKAGFQIDVPLIPVSESQAASISEVRFCGQPFLTAGFDRRYTFEIKVVAWTNLWVVAALSCAGLVVLATSSVPFFLPLSPSYAKYPALYFTMYFSVVPLLVAFSWLGERFLLRHATVAIGSVQAFRKEWLSRSVQYEFRDLEGNIWGSIQPARSIPGTDQLLLVFFYPGNPDINKPALGLSFHTVQLITDAAAASRATAV